jgi:osmotically inducible protein OsmC
MPVRSAKAQWEGNLPEGKGTMSLSGGAYQGPYSFSSRFEDGKGTNPEELIAAAHAGCFSMAFSNQLAKAGFTPKRVSTTANVHLVKGEAGFSIPTIELVTEGEVPGIDNAKFQELADAAKKGCPISKLLTGAEIKLNATLVG